MKTRFILECDEEIDFVVLAINSHKKAYKLCWNINKSLQLSFEKKKDYNIKKGFWFASYTAICDDGVKYNLLAKHKKCWVHYVGQIINFIPQPRLGLYTSFLINNIDFLQYFRL